MYERTLVIVKPDAYARGLVGEIISRFERCRLVVEQIRISEGESDLVDKLYPQGEGWLRTVGSKTLADFERAGLSAVEKLGTNDPIAIGREIRSRLLKYMTSGRIVPMVVGGNRAIETVRKLIGETLPVAAAPGTIRGDLSSDSSDIANHEMRAVANLIHASGDRDDAAREIGVWFPGPASRR